MEEVLKNKEFKIEISGNLYFLKWVGGGEMPKELGGFYTTPAKATEAANHYLANRKARNTNAKNISGKK